MVELYHFYNLQQQLEYTESVYIFTTCTLYIQHVNTVQEYNLTELHVVSV